ncbi:MAG TPA: cytochrome c-type biogenesis protein CcmH [Anaerolineales bacterium]|nr:cytochrome c-type biogenesis protein CcmH [Anaerolineales bacterium]
MGKRSRFQQVHSRPWLAVLIALGVLVMLLVISQSVSAQESNPGAVTDDQVNAIAKQLYCPVCENVPLDVCPTQACAQWRALIRDKLSAGWTENQIKDYFVQQYGDRVLAAPPARGLNWLAYIIPPLAFLAGAFILYRAFRAWKRPLPAVASENAPNGPPADEYIARLEEELRRR